MRPEPAIPGLTPAGCFDLLVPRLADVLVPAGRHRAIREAAALLPPVPRLALEIRLGADEAAVDLHQMITSQDGDPQILLRHLNERGGGWAGAPLVAFLRGWIADEDGLQGWFDPLYLEWDTAPDGGLPQPPALFLACDLRFDDPAVRTRRRTVLRQTLARLCGADGAEPHDRLFDVAERGVTIGHIGVMSGRGDVLRVNYKGITPAALPGLLDRIGWPGDIARLQGHFAALVDVADRVAVAIDLVDGQVRPSIGFEIFCDHPLPSGRWDRILDHLCAHGLCTIEKRAALVNIEATIAAGDAGQPWPAAWILPTIRGPEDAYPAVRCHVSHLKLAIGADGGGQAKAYIGVEHHWRRGFGRPAPQALPAGLAIRPRPSITAATADATAFLLRTRQQNGLWGDFNWVNGGCNNWVTGVAALALAATGEAGALAVAGAALQALGARQQAGGGWGHNEIAPVDTDTTASIVKALDALGAGDSPAAVAARGFLRSHMTDDGFLTYGTATRIRFAAVDVTDAGWRATHGCVMANCALLLPDQLIPLLRRSQAPDGSWTPYWWRTPAYPTALAAEALAMQGDEAAVGRAVAWAKAQDLAALSPFCVAAIARIVIAGGDHGAARDILAGLLRTQLSDGSWAVGADMIWPRPDQAPDHMESQADIIDVPDDRRIFTTAGVLLAFAAARQTVAAPGRNRS
ncbi:terpene cyclase/mutase family protein [Tistrella bauzanensis]|uniref:prenyltransferase/squalene oxidase repeat-containing protein n=1 Tax=Tistrella bauzanensis TaxID=657419 RepID=UPI00166ABC13|nr:prenyltransferase/squalene oxidase repeat-containing protein [Tistrella bauzanensis]